MQSIPKKNEIYKVEITGMSHEGMGIGKVNDFTVFIDGAILGEFVEIKIVKVNKSFAYGKLIKVIEPSFYRVTPQCNIAGKCGGCQIQHMNYKEQLRFKTQKVKDTVERIGKISPERVCNAIGMREPLRYRNKAQYPMGIKDNMAILGFYAPRSHEIIENETCIIQNSVNEDISNEVGKFIKENNISVYNEATHTGLIRHIITKVGFKTGEVMLILVTNGQEFLQKESFIKFMTNKFHNIKSIIQNINTQKTNVIMGDTNILLYGTGYITDYIGEFKFKISPHSFYQVNPVQTEVLYNKALEYAQLSDNQIVFDAYCGIGTISLFLSKCAKKVYGIEIVPQAISDAKENAKINNINNAKFILGKSETVIPKLYDQGIKADVVVVDPPRKGCDKALLDTIIAMKPKRMVYVSCDVGTLARDLRILEDGGYKTVEIQPIDMFPCTAHVETVTLIELK